MIEFGCDYFDGKTSKAHAVTVKLQGETLFLTGEEIKTIDLCIGDCKILPALGKTTRSIMLPGGGRCDTDNLEAIAGLERLLGTNYGMRLVNVIESHWRWVAICLVGLILCSWFFINNGIPFIAKEIASKIPSTLTERISAHTLEVLDKQYLKPTSIKEKRLKKLDAIFKTLVSDKKEKFKFRLEFRKGNIIGANAIALPSGLILMTDELVAMSKDDLEIIGILYHEITHVEKHHTMRSVLQNAGVFLLVSILAGDITSITSVASTLPAILAQSGYSQRFEREADYGAGLYMIEHGWGTKPLQDILIRLTKREPDLSGVSILSTHPATAERVKNLQTLQSKRGI